MSYELYADGKHKVSLGSSARILAVVQYLESNLIHAPALMDFLGSGGTTNPRKVLTELSQMDRTVRMFSLLQELKKELLGTKSATIKG